MRHLGIYMTVQIPSGSHGSSLFQNKVNYFDKKVNPNFQKACDIVKNGPF